MFFVLFVLFVLFVVQLPNLGLLDIIRANFEPCILGTLFLNSNFCFLYDADPATRVLLLDEVDSFLSERTQARHSWERTQANELLQQMERYPGIFIAATNLMSGIDTTALRRFDFKLNFRALTPAQRLRLFAREALGDDQAAVHAGLPGADAPRRAATAYRAGCQMIVGTELHLGTGIVRRP